MVQFSLAAMWFLLASATGSVPYLVIGILCLVWGTVAVVCRGVEDEE